MNYYETLGVSRNSEPEVIEAAYRALMKKYHPDRSRGNADAEPFAKLINEAYATLRDQHRRRAYDRLHADNAGAGRESSWTDERPGSQAPASRSGRCPSPHQRPRFAIHSANRTAPMSRANVLLVGVSASSALIALIALATIWSGAPRQSLAAATQLSTVPPTKASLLSGDRQQIFCITNKTLKHVEYTLYWGGTTGRQYGLAPGFYAIHSSPYSAAPVVEFFASDASEPARKILKSNVSTSNQTSCEPNYSFDNRNMETDSSGNARLGLLRDVRPEIVSPEPAAVKS